jgi:polysaccharide biosynthesis/export protein
MMATSLHVRLARRGAAIAAVLFAAFAFLAPSTAAQAATTQAKAPAAAASSADPDSYRIGAGDTIHITVYQSPDLSVDARVTEAGVISYPLLGRFVIGGMTVTEAEQRLAQALKKGDFVKDPQVMIVVTTVRANQVNVLGQVGKPGRFSLDLAGMRMTEVISLAGGVIAGAGSDTVVLVGTRDGRPYRHEVDLPKIFAPGGSTDDIVVAPGDTIWIDRAPQIYMYGEIQHPGVIRLERGMTVMQAVASGGGATQRGTLKGLRVTRRGADGKMQTFEPAMDDTLKDGDVVFIRESLF